MTDVQYYPMGLTGAYLSDKWKHVSSRAYIPNFVLLWLYPIYLKKLTSPSCMTWDAL